MKKFKKMFWNKQCWRLVVEKGYNEEIKMLENRVIMLEKNCLRQQM